MRRRTTTLVADLKQYQYSWLRGDLMAGITVAIMLIPQGMAYGLLSGLPAIYGLYAALVPLVVYPFFGTSKQLSVGPVALIAIMVMAGLSLMATPGSTEFIHLAILTAFLAGVIQVLLAIFRMGFLVNFLSEPVLAGFTSAAAIIIALSQLKNLLGIQVERASNVIQIIRDLISKLDQIHLPTLLLGASGLVLLLWLKKLRKSLPGALFAIIFGTLVVSLFSLDQSGIRILGAVPRGLPALDVSFFDLANVLKVLPLSLAICLISFIESLAIAKTIAAKHNNYPINANRELMGLGLGKVLGALFQAFPTTGSFTRSAINNDCGAKTGVASLISALFIALVLLFLTSYLFYVPTAILAAIIIAAVLSLINIPYGRQLFALDRKDFYVYLTTLLLTLLLGIQEGVFAGFVLSLLMIIYKSSKPHYAVLGQLPGSSSFRNIKRYDNTIATEGTLIIRYDDDLYFGNANHFYDTIVKEVSKREGTKNLILDCGVISKIDSTGIHYFKLLLATLSSRNIRLILTNLRGPVRDLLHTAQLQDAIGLQNYYLNIFDAVNALNKDTSEGQLSRKYAAQKNIRNP